MQHIRFTLFKKAHVIKGLGAEDIRGGPQVRLQLRNTATWLGDSAGLSAMNGLFVLWNLLQTFVKMDLYNGNLQNLPPRQINNLLCLMLHYWREMFLPPQKAVSFGGQHTGQNAEFKRNAISKTSHLTE